MSQIWVTGIILLALILLAGCTSQQEEFNGEITVVKVHYQEGLFQTPCIILTDTGATYGVDSTIDCMKLENSTARIWSTPGHPIMRVKVKETLRPPAPVYGCPGCPSNFMEFSEDICRRVDPNYTVSDGVNTLRCSEAISTDEENSS